jgi:hypothetical protein
MVAMLDFQRLKELEQHSLLEIDEKKRKGGLPVSQLYPTLLHVPLPLRQPTSWNMGDMQRRWLKFVRIALEKH